MNWIRILLAACLVSLTTARVHAGLAITTDGQPKATIVLAESLRPTDLAVTALVSHIKEISGATLPVIAEKELASAQIQNGRIVPSDSKLAAQNFILLGDGALTHKLGLSLDDLGPGGIVVQTGGNTLALLAKDDHSSSREPASARPVFRFLEALGCRYLWPGETGKVIPRESTITAPDLRVRFTPQIGQRNIRFSPPDARDMAKGLAWLGATVDDYRTGLNSAEQTEATGSWVAWNGLGGNVGIVGGSAGGGLRGGWTEYGATHPEWFALQVDGTRDQSKAKGRWRLCVSNPGLIEHVADDIIARLNGHAQGIISLCPNDGGYSSFCQCEECKKLDPPNAPKVKMLLFAHVGGSERTEVEVPALTDRFVHYWNAIVERVTKVVPDQLFLVEAYSYYSDPPVREKLHPNIVVRYVPSVADGWKGWHDAGARRLYWRPNNLHSGYRDGVLSPKARETAETLNYLGSEGILATDMDSIHNHWATHGLTYYVAARLSWDPSLKFDAVLDDYCQSGFGAGAESVKKYFQLAGKGVVPVTVGQRGAFPKIASETIDQLRGLLVAAAKATEKDAPAHRRVAFLRAGLEFTAINAQAHRLAEAAEAGTPPEAKAVSEVMEHRWQLMRALLQQQPLAVNVGVVAAADEPLNRALQWKGPSESGKAGKLQLPAGDNWLNEDQSATRK
ncbi:hypothetical protein CfE428DRAFT_0571 [Chthoniobacter flavus Ellin428]|uniref:Alpha glucuronidase N-terminal domain-containing protein n=1 Tax=Chthoniobacter flavus Ellin428 TaxID=497964 RepID=B4CV58_9BACT|nr:DUF4838 domain-containing protein [Chthoniobacter flavus]EDY22446.1 hypothetical protein CfE428DRAFT_0571 [Chthoniobacter flavus Ellin428]TCO94545.1 uncharacterized protein DUF4838 [Chthoniobacter flavus]